MFAGLGCRLIQIAFRTEAVTSRLNFLATVEHQISLSLLINL